MPLRSILVILALISLLAVGGGGFFLTAHLSKTAWEVAQQHAEMTSDMISKEINFYLTHSQATVKTLAALPQVRNLPAQPHASAGDINSLLREFCHNEGGDLCYILDSQGTTLAASNFGRADSLIGKNYAFRPYFQRAMADDPAIYLALGVTTRKRGIYFSAPITSNSGDIQGVAVVKFPVEELEREYQSLSGIFALIDPNGIVFASNQSQWLFHSMFEVTSPVAASIKQSRQYGNQPPASVGLIESADGLLQSKDGVRYLFGAPDIPALQGWKAYYLFDAANISSMLRNGTGGMPFALIFSLLFLLIGTIVIFLYQRATAEIERRREVEHHLRDSEEKYRLLFERSEDPMWVIYDNAFMLANRAAALILQYENEQQLRNIHPSALSPEYQPDGMSSAEKASQMIRLAYQNGYHRFEWEHKRRSGEVFPVEVSLTRIPYEDHDALYCVWRDISESKRARQALEKAMVAAEKANRAKSEFLSSMSHEIRTPMTGVMGFADMLLDDELPPESRDKVLRIKGATHSLLRLINDILDMSKLEAGKMEIEQVDFDLKALFEEVLSLFDRTRRDDRPVNLILQIDDSLPLAIHSDPTRLRQILVNLVGNALKFTHQGEVTLYGELIDDEGQKLLQIGVRDTGIGISAEARSKLFQQFSQADASISRRYEGTGLGLAISKRLTELLGGRIDAESKPGVGSHFWLKLPYVAAHAQPPQLNRAALESEKKYRGIRSLKVLVAEDNRVNQMIIRRFMQAYGHEVDLVENGQKALERCEQADFDMVLMDVRMPVMDGIEATHRIRAMQGHNSTIPIIAVTADAMKEYRQAIFDSGMNGFVSKPFNRAELALTINEVMAEDIHVIDDVLDNDTPQSGIN